MIYVYESHTGGYYTTDEPLPDEALYCEECGDSDVFLGKAETNEEAERIMRRRELDMYDDSDRVDAALEEMSEALDDISVTLQKLSEAINDLRKDI